MSLKFFRTEDKKGIVALATILLLGAVIAEIGMAGLLIVYVTSSANFGARLSFEALSAAKSGIEDAMLNIARNKDFTPSPNPYTVNLQTRSVSVLIERPSSGRVKITALGMAFNKQKKIEALMDVNDVTGNTRTIYINEVPL